jgi:hypothetical protein
MVTVWVYLKNEDNDHAPSPTTVTKCPLGEWMREVAEVEIFRG